MKKPLALAAFRWTTFLETALPSLLPKECLLELNRSNFEAQREFWAAEAERGLSQDEERALAPALARGGRALCLACGGGREALALATRGFEVSGVEAVRALAEHAQGRARVLGVSARFAAEDLTDFESADARFELVTLLNVAYSYIPTRAARVAVLRKCLRWLIPGGRCAASFVVRAPSRSELRLHRTLRPAARLFGNDGHEPGDRLFGAGNFIHFFPAPDAVADEFREAGFGEVSWTTTAGEEIIAAGRS